MLNQHSALILICEYLSAPDPQARRNAVTALAALPSDEAVRHVWRTALTDADMSVRQRAEDELSTRIALESLNRAAQEQLQSASTALPTYVLLGRLRGRGVAVRLPAVSLFRRIRYALAQRRLVAGEFRPSLWKSALFGALGAVFVVIGYLGALLGPNINPDSGGALIAASLAFPLSAVIATRRWWRPMQDQVDRLVATLIDALCLGLLGFAIAGVLAVVSTVDSMSVDSGVAWFDSLPIAGFCGAAGFIAVRLGALASHGAFKGVSMNQLAQVLGGVAAGFLATTAVAVFSNDDSVTLARVWIVLVPILFGLAWVCSEIDRSAYLFRPAQRLVGRGTPWLLATLVIAGGLAAVVPVFGDVVLRERDTESIVVGDASATVNLGPLPAALNFSVDAGRVVQFTVASGESGGDFHLGLWRGAAPSIRRTDFLDQAKRNQPGDLDYRDDPDPPEIEEYLVPGKYFLLVDRFSGSDSQTPRYLSEALPILRKRFRNQATSGNSLSPAVSIVPKPRSDLRVAIAAATPDRPPAEVDPNDADALHAAGSELFNHSKYRAGALYARALKIDPQHVPSLLGRSNVFRWLNRVDLAVDDLKTLLALQPNNSEALRVRAYVAYELKDLAGAKRFVDAAIANNPNDVLAFEWRAVIYRELGQFDLSVEDANQAIRLDSKRETGYLQRALGRGDQALSRGEQQRYEEAVTDYRKIITDMNTIDAAPYSGLAWTLNHQAKHQDALAAAETALRLEPDLANGYKNRGRSQYFLNRFDAARADLDQAVALNEDLAEAYWYRADVREKTGDLSGAQEDREKAKALNYMPPGAPSPASVTGKN